MLIELGCCDEVEPIKTFINNYFKVELPWVETSYNDIGIDQVVLEVDYDQILLLKEGLDILGVDVHLRQYTYDAKENLQISVGFIDEPIVWLDYYWVD